MEAVFISHTHGKILVAQQGAFLNYCSSKFFVHTGAKTELHFSARPLGFSTLFSALFSAAFHHKVHVLNYLSRNRI